MNRTFSVRAGLGLALTVFLFLAGCNQSSNNSNSGASTTTNTSSTTSTNSKSSISSNSNSSSSSTNSSSSNSSSSNSASSGNGSSASRFIGTWKGTEGPVAGVTLTIKDDGTFTVSLGQEGTPQFSTYTASGETLTLKAPEGKGDDATCTLEADGRLKVTDKSGEAQYFVKQ